MRTWLLLSLALMSCAHFDAQVPPGFVELGRSSYGPFALRAVTPDGLVLAVRDVENAEVDGHPNGDAAFWVKAVSNHLRDTGGYALLGQREVTTRSGAHGTVLSYGHDEGRTPHRYDIALFFRSGGLLLVEAGGEKALFEAHAADVERFIAEFEPH